jgi:hypothetical protein
MGVTHTDREGGDLISLLCTFRKECRLKGSESLNPIVYFRLVLPTSRDPIPSNGATAQIGPWPPLLRFHNSNVLRCEVVSLTTNPR